LEVHSSGRWSRGVSRTVATILIVGVLVVAAVGVYASGLFGQSKSTSSSSTRTSTSTSSTSSSTVAVRNSLVVEEALQPDSLDPTVTFQTPGWEIVDQVYQGLLTFNGTTSTSYVPVLALNWNVSKSALNYTFSLRHGVTFSNGDPFNAYVLWFSVYRTLILNQAPAFILSQNLAPGNGRTFNVTAAALQSMNYFNPSAQNVSYMGKPGQSVQVIDRYTIRFNLGYGTNGMAPFNAFLQTLTTPMAMAVDPAVVMANGGVVAGQPNTWMVTSMVGTGFYKLQSWIQGQSVTLVKDPNYWGNSLSASQLNYAIQPAVLNTVIIYYKATSARIADLQAGTAQIIEAPATNLNSLKSMAGVTATTLPLTFGSAANVFYVYMNPLSFSAFSNTFVRQAVVEAIDYSTLVRVVLGNQGIQWIGPVPPGFPLYNETTAGLSPYSYNPTAAALHLAQAGYQSTLPDGTKLNPKGAAFPTTNFLYNPDSTVQTQAAQVIQGDLAAIGMKLTLAPVATSQYFAITSSPGNTNTTYPIGIDFFTEDYTATIDYVSYFVTSNFIGTSAYSNSTVTAWETTAATAQDTATVVKALQNITRSMYFSYTDVWLFVPSQLAVNQNNVAGMIPNPAGSGAGYFLFYNVVHYSS
jgi:peptide/nickel transport system substrate-binding protein